MTMFLKVDTPEKRDWLLKIFLNSVSLKRRTGAIHEMKEELLALPISTANAAKASEHEFGVNVVSQNKPVWKIDVAHPEKEKEGFGFTFGLALEQLRLGRRVTRTGWNGKGMWLELQVPDAKSKMTLPYIFLNYYPAGGAENPKGVRVPWVASQTDMLADDWIVAV